MYSRTFSFICKHIVLYNIFTSTDGAVRRMFLSSHLFWTSDCMHFGIIYGRIIRGHTRRTQDFLFYFTLYNCRCLVKSNHITRRNSNAILRVPILLVVQLNLLFMYATKYYIIFSRVQTRPIHAVCIWTSDYTYFGIIYGRTITRFIFYFFTLYNCRCLVKLF